METVMCESCENTEVHDSAILMSLLDDQVYTQIDNCRDDERLRNVIQSLEEEIHDPPHGLNFVRPAFEGRFKDLSDDQDRSWLGKSGCVDGQDSATTSDLGFSWMDMEFMPTSPSLDMTNWYSDLAEDANLMMVEMYEYDERFFDYFQFCSHDVFPTDESVQGNLWQDTF